MKRMPIFLLATGAVLCQWAADKPFPSDQLVSVATHRLQIHREGKGAPTIVVDAGISDGLDKLRPLQERLAKVTHVCTYNRAGYGQSEPGPLPRDCGREAEELKALLNGAGVPGPYIVVGHSLGALNMQVFASRYPDDVAGIVLLDPPPLSFILREDYESLGPLAEKMTAEWQAIADSVADSADAKERARAAFFLMIASEHREMFGESARLVADILSFGDTPLVVMAAGKPDPRFGDGAEAYQRYWIEQSRALCQKSSNSRFVLADNSTHYLYLDVPDLVVENILSVVR